MVIPPIAFINKFYDYKSSGNGEIIWPVSSGTGKQ